LTVNTSFLNSEAKLLSATGQELLTIPITKIETKIKTDGFTTGIYFIKLKNGETMKFLKD
jgi:hypothetical protein